MSANLLAKVTNGLCDDLLTTTVRAWDTDGMVDGRKKRIIVAPAMNVAMWNHPVTARQLRVLEGEWGIENGGWFEVLRPQEKTLACGDVGTGAMKEWGEIVKVMKERLSLENE
jgi:phosphopantothenoylcysteine decarboxylase